MPFFATRRIIEGLGLGGPSGCPKARSRRFDVGVGPVGLPEKTFWATAEASATASEGRVARARFRNFGAGSWPVGLPEATFWATAEASATAMANPRRRSRTLRNFGAGGWPVGLPETIFRSFCDNLPRARFRRFGAKEWPDGLSERSFRATQSGGILDAAAAYAAGGLYRNTGGPDYQGRGPGQWPQWPFYQPEADKWPDLLDSGCGWSISYCPV